MMPAPSRVTGSPSPSLDRRLGPLDAAVIVISNVIGIGIFCTFAWIEVREALLNPRNPAEAPLSSLIGRSEMEDRYVRTHGQFVLGGGMAMQDEGVASLYNSTAEALHAGAGTQIDRRAIGRTLDTLPPSYLTLQGTVMLLTLLPDARRDPALSGQA